MDEPLDPAAETTLQKQTRDDYAGGFSNTKVNDLKENLDEDRETSDHERVEIDPYDSSAPVLLFGHVRPVSKEEMLIDIPPRPIADHLISRFFNSSEPARVSIHVPTYQKEYEEFWRRPTDQSFTWISLLYSIMALSVSPYHRYSEPLPSGIAGPTRSWDIFRKRASQCLIQANYITPGRYKPEALFLYSIAELYRSRDAQVGVSYLLGITIRLAMRMDYHRDPRHYPMLSAFDGEMRRRVWGLLVQLDTVISFQVGIPRTIQPWQYDTHLPSNLLDTDFDQSSVHLPPERPENEETDCLYMWTRSIIMKVFGQITDLAFSQKHSNYDEALDIDSRLETAHNMVPSCLKIRPMAQCVADRAELTMRRFTLELLYQNARLVLHRRYITKLNISFAYPYSRSARLAAAHETLRYHKEIWAECRPFGQLYTERFFLGTLQHYFLHAAMILCLEMCQDADRGDTACLRPQERAEERAEFLLLLEETHSIFIQSRHPSVDSQRAVNVLTIILKRVKKDEFRYSTSIAGQSAASIDSDISMQSTSAAAFDPQYSSYSSNIGELQPAIPNPGQISSYSSLEAIEKMLDIPTQFDWNVFDSYISGAKRAANDHI
ncbi:uncharacterized protein N7479_007086 [Penicillium vulpinum]|uniref:uncharacterized protein n=1 Tax=Penicillium vulpinum TaxID=29845 RepID=UPI002547D3A9|nr:uncharacterized protein N7479_007086 [Penicillium vulpinum]KAJ5959936.1 hypothetical protein N7479_007086 [Penicillium vulpinum]